MMIDKKRIKMGRRPKTGNTGVKLKALIDVFKLETEIPVSYKFARQFNLLPVEHVESPYSGELILD
jgi:hypothetical protein